MTPSEKAKDLIEKFIPYVWSGASYIGIEEVEMMRDNPKELAKIFVNEMLSCAGYIWGGRTDEQLYITARDEYRKYWDEVKEEILKL